MKNNNYDWLFKSLIVIFLVFFAWTVIHSFADEFPNKDIERELDAILNEMESNDVGFNLEDDVAGELYIESDLSLPDISVGLEERDGSPVVLLDIPKALANKEVKRSWNEVQVSFEESHVLLKIPNALIQAIQATGRTVYEPVEEIGRYSIQSPLHMFGSAIAAYLVGASISNDLDDHIDEIGDQF